MHLVWNRNRRRFRKLKGKDLKIKINKTRTLAFCLFVGAAVLGCGCAGSGVRAKAGKTRVAFSAADGRNVVRSLDFVGNHTYKDKTLKGKLDFDIGDLLDPVLAETGRGIIKEFYRKKGFPHAVVMWNKVRMSAGHLLYIIDEGPRMRIRSVMAFGLHC